MLDSVKSLVEITLAECSEKLQIQQAHDQKELDIFCSQYCPDISIESLRKCYKKTLERELLMPKLLHYKMLVVVTCSAFVEASEQLSRIYNVQYDLSGEKHQLLKEKQEEKYLCEMRNIELKTQLREINIRIHFLNNEEKIKALQENAEKIEQEIKDIENKITEIEKNDNNLSEEEAFFSEYFHFLISTEKLLENMPFHRDILREMGVFLDGAVKKQQMPTLEDLGEFLESEEAGTEPQDSSDSDPFAGFDDNFIPSSSIRSASHDSLQEPSSSLPLSSPKPG